MRLRPLLATGLFAMLLLVFGCTKTSTGPTTADSDRQQISDLIANEDSASFSTTDIVAEAPLSTGSAGRPALGTDSAIVPVRWGRVHMRVVARTTATTFNTTNDTATTTIDWTIAGIMRIITATDSIDKPYRDVYLKKAVYARIGHTRQRAMNWRLLKTTPMTALTEGETASFIASVTWLRKGNGTADWTQTGSTLVDPANWWQLTDSIAIVHPGDSLKVRITTMGTSPYYSLIHYYPQARTYQRIGGTNNTDFSWEVTAYVPTATAALRLLYVDVISDGTVHSATAPYRANIWGLLYKVQ